jgi:hypothetical protein
LLNARPGKLKTHYTKSIVILIREFNDIILKDLLGMRRHISWD